MKNIVSKIVMTLFAICLLFAVYDLFLKDLLPQNSNEPINSSQYNEPLDVSTSVYDSSSNNSETIIEENYENNSNSDNQNNSNNIQDQSNNSLDLKIQEFEEARSKISNDYLDAKSKNYSNSQILKSLAFEYKRYMSALSIQIKTFYSSNSQNLTSGQKQELDYIYQACDLAIQQADIDGGAF